MHKVGALNADGRSVVYEDGVFTLEGSDRVGPRQLLGWADMGVLAWEQPGMREWVARRASMSPSPRGGSRSRRVAAVAAVTAVILVAGSVLGWMAFQGARYGASGRYGPLIRVEDARKAKAESDFRTLSQQHPEVDAAAVSKAAEGAR